jgi:hypothetical protein
MAILHIDAETRTRACGYINLTKWSRLGRIYAGNDGNDTTLDSCKMLTC